MRGVQVAVKKHVISQEGGQSYPCDDRYSLLLKAQRDENKLRVNT